MRFQSANICERISIKPCVSILFEYKFNFNLLFNKKKLTSKKRYSKETILPNKRIKIMLCKQVPGLKPCAFIHLHQKITTKIHPGVGISCALAACQQISLPMLVTWAKEKKKIRIFFFFFYEERIRLSNSSWELCLLGDWMRCNRFSIILLWDFIEL